MDIKALEIEFAKNPKSDVFIDLCEAYIENKRFMEAMVVCKKGIKNLPPDDLRGRLMLVKIYEAQGKKPKADQEMAQLQKEFPGHPMLTGGSPAPAAAAPQPAMNAAPMMPPAAGPAPAAGAPLPGANPFAQAPTANPFAQAPTANPFAPAPGANPFEQAAQGANPFAPAPGTNPFEQAAQGANPFAPAPGANPFEQTGGIFAQNSAGSMDDPKLEHVSDFFSQNALGFSNNAIPEGMTAGKGRLTIVGFVPKQSTNFKYTIIALIVVLLGAGIGTFLFKNNADKQKEITKIFKDVKEQVDRDTYYNYESALELTEQIMKIDDSHHETLCVMAFANAALALDHNVAGALEKAEKYMAMAEEASDKQYSYGIAAKAMIYYMKKDYENGIKWLDDLVNKGATSDLVNMELFRLRNKVRPGEDDTKKVLVLLNQASGSARVFSFLADYYYAQGDFTKSGSMAGQGLNSNKEHLLNQAYIQLNILPQEFDATENIPKTLDKLAKMVEGTKGSAVDQAVFNITYGMYHLKFLRFEEAQKYFDKVDRKNVPESMIYMRAKMYVEAKKFAEALEDIKFVLALSPDKANYLLVQAEAQMENKEYEAAAQSLAAATKAEADNPKIAYLTAYSMELQGQKKEAIEAYGKVQNTNPDIYIDAHIRAAHLIVATGDKKGGLKYAEDLLHNPPPGCMQPQQAKMFTLYGEMYEVNGQKDTAMETYVEAREIFRMYSVTHYYMCRLDKSATSACKTYLRLTPWGEYREDAAKRAKCDLNNLMECFAAK